MNQEKKEYIENWLFRAREDISLIKNLVDSGIESYTSSICFHAQQGVEKYLKSFLILHDIDFPRTHDVDYLLSECQKIDINSFEIDLKSLTEFGVSIRYPDDFFIPSVKEAQEYYEITIQISEIVENLISLPD